MGFLRRISLLLLIEKSQLRDGLGTSVECLQKGKRNNCYLLNRQAEDLEIDQNDCVWTDAMCYDLHPAGHPFGSMNFTNYGRLQNVGKTPILSRFPFVFPDVEKLKLLPPLRPPQPQPQSDHPHRLRQRIHSGISLHARAVPPAVTAPAAAVAACEGASTLRPTPCTRHCPVSSGTLKRATKALKKKLQNSSSDSTDTFSPVLPKANQVRISRRRVLTIPLQAVSWCAACGHWPSAASFFCIYLVPHSVQPFLPQR
ncbi:unnamed protein product [Soboliphyme baturini]|uniref:Uncharacterized protein n=1 Tax=Soboliphyme baturini TaxID=241478 RepID=A0A183IR07_9BILA|nr:unnamed protein product [Soboliphyme baturini]